MTKIYCDGACKGNPGKGGWGVWVESAKIGISGGSPSCTNNQMELTAAIEAMRYCLENQIKDAVIVTDSQYVKNGLESWLAGWKKKGWKTTTGPVKNLELWQELDRLNGQLKPKLQWVRGHSGVPGNEKADVLANKGCEQHLRSVVEFS